MQVDIFVLGLLVYSVFQMCSILYFLPVFLLEYVCWCLRDIQVGYNVLKCVVFVLINERFAVLIRNNHLIKWRNMD